MATAPCAITDCFLTAADSGFEWKANGHQSWERVTFKAVSYASYASISSINGQMKLEVCNVANAKS